MMRYKKTTKIISFIVIVTLCIMVGCSKENKPVETKINNETKLEEGISLTTAGKDYNLKYFDICEMKSTENNTYAFLRFKNPNVSNKNDNSYFSANGISADMYFKVYETPEKSPIEVLDEATSHIKENIIESTSGEGDNLSYRAIKYTYNDFKKVKFIACLKTDSGYVIYDFSFYESDNENETEINKGCLKDIFKVLGVSTNE